MAAEPAFTAASAVATTIATSATVIGIFGLHPGDVAAAAVGSLLGLAATESAGRVRSIALFLLSSPIAALAAQAAAPYMPVGNESLRHLAAALLAGMFPALFVVARDTLATRFPALFDRVLQVFGGTK